MSVKTKIVKNRLPNLTGAVRRSAVRVINETAEEVLEIARGLAPEDTGELKRSGHLENQNDTVKMVVFDAEYAKFVEFGTVNSPAQPFLSPAHESVRSRLNRRLGQIGAGLSKDIGL